MPLAWFEPQYGQHQKYYYNNTNSIGMISPFEVKPWKITTGLDQSKVIEHRCSQLVAKTIKLLAVNKLGRG